MSQESVLKYLKKNEGARSQEIAKALSLSIQATVSTLSRLLKNMEIEKEERDKKIIYKIKNGR